MNRERRKVPHVLGGLWPGGTESFVMNMFREADKSKVEFVFLVHDAGKMHYDDEIMAAMGLPCLVSEHVSRLPALELGF